jgi:hypothetical protein
MPSESGDPAAGSARGSVPLAAGSGRGHGAKNASVPTLSRLHVNEGVVASFVTRQLPIGTFAETSNIEAGQIRPRVARLPRDPQRRGRLWLLNAFANALLTLLGAAREALGCDPPSQIKFNTAKRRTHSLFCQGAVAYALIPKTPETRLRPPLERFDHAPRNPGLRRRLRRCLKMRRVLRVTALCNVCGGIIQELPAHPRRR